MVHLMPAFASIKPPKKSELLIDIGQLPTCSLHQTKLNRIAKSGDASIGDFEAIAVREPAFALRILQAANSAVYGSQRVDTLHRAVTVLGLQTLQSLAQSMNASPTFDEEEASLVDSRQIWKHLLATAFWTGVVARRVKFLDTNLLFTWGLLHDIGLLVFAEVCPSELECALRLVRRGSHSLEEAELAILKISHTQLCDALCQKWMLPSDFGQQLANHHSFKMQQTVPGKIFALAEHLALCSGMGEFSWTPIPKKHPSALLRSVGLEKADVEQLLKAAPSIDEKIRLCFEESSSIPQSEEFESQISA